MDKNNDCFDNYLSNTYVFNDDKKYVIYHAGHYGYIVKSIIHAFHYHPNENLLILFDEINCSEKTLIFLKTNLNQFNFGKIIIYSENNFWKDVTEKEEEEYIVQYFDNMLKGIELKNISNIYSGFDDRNAFAAYLHLKNIPYAIFDVNSQTYWEMYDRIDHAHPNWFAYNLILRKYRCLNNNAKNVKEILWDRPNHKDVDGKQNTTISFNKLFNTLTSEQKTKIKNYYKLPQLTDDRSLLLLSSSHFTYSGPELLRTLKLEDRFTFPYYLVLDLLNIDFKTLIVKSHPFYDLGSDKTQELFPNCTYLEGFVPADILEASEDFKIREVISIETTSASFSCSTAKHISFDALYTSSSGYLPLHAIFAILRNSGVSKITHNSKRNAYMTSIVKEIFNNAYDLQYMKTGKETELVLLDSAEPTINEDLSKIKQDDNGKNIIIYNSQLQLVDLELDIPTNYYKLNLNVKRITSHSKILQGHNAYIITSFLNEKLKKIFDSNTYHKHYKHLGIETTVVTTDNLNDIKEYSTKKLQQIIKNLSNGCDQTYLLSVLCEGYKRNIRGSETALGIYYYNNNRGQLTKELIDKIEMNADKNPDACLLLGKIYHFGINIEKDEIKAATFLRKTIKYYKWASNLLFDVLWNIGTEKTDMEMIEVISKQILTGNPDSIFRLSQAYRYGRGVEKNQRLYLFWLKIAAEEGNLPAQKIYSEVIQ